jgi:hypothetical protein
MSESKRLFGVRSWAQSGHLAGLPTSGTGPYADSCAAANNARAYVNYKIVGASTAPKSMALACRVEGPSTASRADIPWQECAPSCCLLVKQGLRLLQVQRVKALSEPAVNRSKQFNRLLHLALVAPEAREAHGGAEFPGLGLLLAGYSECASEFDLSLALTLHREERIADNTVELGFEHTFIHVLHGGKGHQVWREDAFRVSRAADQIVGQQPDEAYSSTTLPYGEAVRTLQIDMKRLLLGF